LKVKMNGVLLQDNGPLRNEELLEYIDNNFHNSLSEALQAKFQAAIQNTEWYQYEHPNFDLVKNTEQVKNICGEDPDCYADALNWTIMNKTEITSNIYKFISHRVSVVKDGLTNNFLPDRLNWDAFIDNWDLVLDCILWFF
jgi:hypothetical protein